MSLCLFLLVFSVLFVRNFLIYKSTPITDDVWLDFWNSNINTTHEGEIHSALWRTIWCSKKEMKKNEISLSRLAEFIEKLYRGDGNNRHCRCRGRCRQQQRRRHRRRRRSNSNSHSTQMVCESDVERVIWANNLHCERPATKLPASQSRTKSDQCYSDAMHVCAPYIHTDR